MLLALDELQRGFGIVRRDDADHADAHVEDLIEFFFRHAALLLNDLEDRQHVP